MEGLESAFDRFGGVPQELLFDQMRAVVLSDLGSRFALYPTIAPAAGAWC